MLKIIPDPKFKADVAITVPGVDEPVAVKMEFKYLGRKEYSAFFEGMKDKPLLDALGELILGWDGFDAPYNAKNLETFLDAYPAAGLEIVSAYQRALFESRVKN